MYVCVYIYIYVAYTKHQFFVHCGIASLHNDDVPSAQVKAGSPSVSWIRSIGGLRSHGGTPKSGTHPAIVVLPTIF